MLEVLGNASLVFGNGSLHAFEDSRAATVSKLEWVGPLESIILLFYMLFHRFETTCFCI